MKSRHLIVLVLILGACGGSQFSASGNQSQGGVGGTVPAGAGTKGVLPSSGTSAGGNGADQGGNGGSTITVAGSPGRTGGGSGSAGAGGASGGMSGASAMGGFAGSGAGVPGGGQSGNSGSGGGSATTSPPSCAASENAECQGSSCCTTIWVPSGSFTLGGDVVTPTSAASVASFNLDKYEVTVGRFRRFVSAYSGPPAVGAGAHPLIANSGWQSAWNTTVATDAAGIVSSMKSNCSSNLQTWTDAPAANEQLPINCITWYEAFAFCAWDEGRLPIEAEWEYAAAGADQERLFPWGTATPTLQLADYGCLGDSVAGCMLADILPVGSEPSGAGRWGHQDLAGSVWEYMLDFSGAYPTTCDNCADVTTGGNRVQRGGSWRTAGDALRAADHTAATTTTGADSVGVRCARDGGGQ
jgi:sulfatase modifying factor 1